VDGAEPIAILLPQLIVTSPASVPPATSFVRLNASVAATLRQ
jgi:hypothetical protein